MLTKTVTEDERKHAELPNRILLTNLRIFLKRQKEEKKQRRHMEYQDEKDPFNTISLGYNP